MWGSILMFWWASLPPQHNNWMKQICFHETFVSFISQCSSVKFVAERCLPKSLASKKTCPTSIAPPPRRHMSTSTLTNLPILGIVVTPLHVLMQITCSTRNTCDANANVAKKHWIFPWMLNFGEILYPSFWTTLHSCCLGSMKTNIQIKYGTCILSSWWRLSNVLPWNRTVTFPPPPLQNAICVGRLHPGASLFGRSY